MAAEHQVNIALENDEMDLLVRLCEEQKIKRPSTLAAMWVRQKIAEHSPNERSEVLAMAEELGMDVAADALAKALQRKKGKKAA